MQGRLKEIGIEFVHHLPYSAVGVAASLGILLAWEKMGGLAPQPSFHLFHPVHILFSAVVTTAMFWKYEKRAIKATLVGFFGTVPICSISDVFLPYLGGIVLKNPVQFHLCATQEPWLVYPAAIGGIFFGFLLPTLLSKLTEFTHLLHVLVSSLASMLYLISFDLGLWQGSLLLVFFITVLAVWIPCCLSDIVFPLTLARKEEGISGHH